MKSFLLFNCHEGFLLISSLNYFYHNEINPLNFAKIIYQLGADLDYSYFLEWSLR